jgi:hypothetical protein
MDANSNRTPKLCRKVVQTLCILGSGYWSNTNFRFLHVNKSLKQLKLFECTVTKGTRLICQRCKAFSPRRTGDGSNGIIFADFIRVWAMLRLYTIYTQYLHAAVLQQCFCVLVPKCIALHACCYNH